MAEVAQQDAEAIKVREKAQGVIVIISRGPGDFSVGNAVSENAKESVAGLVAAGLVYLAKEIIG